MLQNTVFCLHGVCVFLITVTVNADQPFNTIKSLVALMEKESVLCESHSQFQLAGNRINFVNNIHKFGK
jgi:hypothetical protein